MQYEVRLSILTGWSLCHTSDYEHKGHTLLSKAAAEVACELDYRASPCFFVDFWHGISALVPDLHSLHKDVIALDNAMT